MTEPNQGKLFGDRIRVTRIRRTALVVALMCFIAVLLTMFCCLSSNEKANEESIESEQQENAAWLRSAPHTIKENITSHDQASTEQDISSHQDQKEKLANALHEIEREQKNSSYENTEMDSANSPEASSITINLKENEQKSENNPGGFIMGSLRAGTLISATLITELTNELPGLVLAQVARSIYDDTGSRILLPQGTKILLSYNTSETINQKRIGLQATTLIFPNGKTQPIDNLTAVDVQGNMGLHDKVEHHYINNFLSLCVPNIAAATRLVAHENKFDPALDVAEQFVENTGPQLLNPTIHIRRGQTFNLLVTKDISIQNH